MTRVSKQEAEKYLMAKHIFEQEEQEYFCRLILGLVRRAKKVKE